MQITVAEPSVSTAASLRMMACRRAMRCTPSASTAVTIAGSPSGTAATASATPMIITSMERRQPSRVDEDDRGDHHDRDHDHASRALPVRSSSAARASPLARLFEQSGDAPISVGMPVAVTTARPWPYVARAAEDHVGRSPSGASASIGSISFVTGRLSPVSAASAVCSAADSTSRASAGWRRLPPEA